MKFRSQVSLALFCCVVFAASFSRAQEDAQAEKTPPPPCTDPEYSQFDFWLGNWRVTDEDGKFQGTNRVERVLGKCAIEENWVGAEGSKGHSFNMYDKRRGVWHQTWIGDHGLLLLLDGGLDENGNMVLKGQLPARDGKGMVDHEITWEKLDDGRVRQTWRASRDDGETWQKLFVGYYERQDE
ncbi:MAG TPA: hypothetical protein VKA63_08785 [Candidatus Krumholzibacteria bacterium]|nr:hypothetical protein [Candidatus Krumholzibacteria bacterium]